MSYFAEVDSVANFADFPQYITEFGINRLYDTTGIFMDFKRARQACPVLKSEVEKELAIQL